MSERNLEGETVPTHVAARSPLLVYGTLRTGGANHRMLAGRAEVLGLVNVQGYRLVDSGGWFPYAVRHHTTGHPATPSIVCEVLRLLPHHADEVIRDLDRLEGFKEGSAASMFVRAPVAFTPALGPHHNGWMYVASAETQGRISALHTIESGDWIRRA